MTTPRLKVSNNRYVGKWECKSVDDWPGFGATPEQAYLEWAERRGMRERMAVEVAKQLEKDRSRCKQVADALNAPWPVSAVVVPAPTRPAPWWYQLFRRVLGFK